MDLKDMMKMAQGEEGPDNDKVMAKREILQALRQMASELMGEDMEAGMKQVSVAAPDKEGLMEGMEKAEEVVEEMPEMDMEKDESYEPGMEMEDDMYGGMSREELIEMLKEMKG